MRITGNGLVLAEQPGQLHAAPLVAGRVAVLHIGEGLEQRRGRTPGAARAHRGVAVGGDHVVGGQRRREGGAALAEDLEEHAEAAARPVDLALDHRHADQLALT